MKNIGNFLKALQHAVTGFGLNLVAHVLDPIISIPGAIYSAATAPTNGHGAAGWLQSVGDDQMNRALAVDQSGQQKDAALFNATLTKGATGTAVFGTTKESISGKIGENVRNGTLSGTGRVVNSILNLLQKNHSIGSIDPNAEKINDPVVK